MRTVALYLIFFGGIAFYIWSLRGVFGSKKPKKTMEPAPLSEDEQGGGWSGGDHQPPPGYGPPPYP